MQVVGISNLNIHSELAQRRLGMQVMGASRVRIDSERVAHDAIRRASAARSTDATNMNAVSSRSHSIFSLHITGTHSEGERLLGSLHLVDLAGSERLARSGAEGNRQKETCAINKSLSSLGDIFQVSLATHLRAGVILPPGIPSRKRWQNTFALLCWLKAS
jgi:kinesin family member C1